MADERKMNFKALKGVDPYIERIEDFATQVALYKYASSEWEKLDIEGTLFVNRRQDDPKYGFIILNRLSDKNLVEPVTKELDFQEGCIFGIWFFDPKECERIHKKMESCVKIVEKRLSSLQESKSQNGEENIIALLQKASLENEEEASSKKSSAPESPCKEDGDKLLRLLNGPKAVVENGNACKNDESGGGRKEESPPPTTANSVADFFAKASKNGSAFSTPLLTSSAAAPLGVATTFSPAGVIHHPALMPMAPGPIPMIPLQGFHGMGGAAGHHPVHVPVALHQSWQQQPESHPLTRNAENVPQSQEPGQDENPATQRLFSIPGSYPVEFIERSQRGDSGTSTPHFQPITPGKGQVQHKLVKTSKGTEPELMSPMAFAHNPAKKSISTNETVINGVHLNEGQLVQAMKHLLTNDSTFVTKTLDILHTNTSKKNSNIKMEFRNTLNNQSTKTIVE
ncbi:DCP1B [Lepeophtheirus salmonis]|uniref:DCP1B n=1 Tax=Lepeophtheirus salmonis TaxID=72036 RepID=A0A7R8H9G7_LEPSM|nr:DCP1B [Lepeophtheirus salmonis]CAF2949254.1 DCP1B [Lepeophtheirus salmonis]